jgi:hypothetical protein
MSARESLRSLRNDVRFYVGLTSGTTSADLEGDNEIMSKRGFLVAALLAALVLPAAAVALARTVPKGFAAYLLGPRMIRAEIALKTSDGVLHDFLVDRGRLVRRYSRGTLVLLERDGTKVSVKTASSARVTLNGRPSNLRALRPGTQVVVSHDHDLPADTVYAGAPKKTLRLPRAVPAFLLGPRMFRAEIALESADGVTHDFRLDQGRIRQVTPTTVVLREADGTIASIEISLNVRVKVNGQNAGVLQLKRGMIATTMRDGDKPAEQIWASGK